MATKIKIIDMPTNHFLLVFNPKNSINIPNIIIAIMVKTLIKLPPEINFSISRIILLMRNYKPFNRSFNKIKQRSQFSLWDLINNKDVSFL